MSLILSLQGCMAVGKTSAVQYVQSNVPSVTVSYETNTDIIEQVKSRQLNKNVFDDYIEIQKLWIQKEISRWKQAQQSDCSLMDFGAEEIEFYTLNYPKTIGVDWDVEAKLHDTLEQLRKCMPNRILYLDADESTLIRNKENDRTRSRTFFEYHLKYLLPLKREWFSERKNVDLLRVDNLTKNEVGEQVRKWVEQCIALYSGQ